MKKLTAQEAAALDAKHAKNPHWRSLKAVIDAVAEVMPELFDHKAKPLIERIAALEAETKALKADRPTLADAYKGTWQPSAFDAYARGDAVTFDGSLWLARAVTRTKPGTDDTWQMIVKKGRDAS